MSPKLVPPLPAITALPTLPLDGTETRYVIKHDGLFWRPDQRGYTPNLLEAGIYSAEFAQHQEKCRPDNPDLAVTLVEALAELRINPEVLDALLISRGAQ